jgi:hypothetical protein
LPSPSVVSHYFNSLPESDRARIMRNGLGATLLQSGLSFAVPLWWVFRDADGYHKQNGTAFLVDFEGGGFAVTAAHVFSAYLSAKDRADEIGCQFGPINFEPASRMIACSTDLDIATFRISADEAAQIGATPVRGDPPGWSPLEPVPGNFAFFAGFLEQTAGTASGGQFFATVSYYAMPVITSRHGSAGRMPVRPGQNGRRQRKRATAPGLQHQRDKRRPDADPDACDRGGHLAPRRRGH